VETAAALLGNTVQVCQKHYAPWVALCADPFERFKSLHPNGDQLQDADG
jgi:hypothetical protein